SRRWRPPPARGLSASTFRKTSIHCRSSPKRWNRAHRGFAPGFAEEIAMKMTINVECTPEEARAFLGLPDLTPVNETLVSAVKQRIEQNIEMVSPEFYLKQWYSMGGQA